MAEQSPTKKQLLARLSALELELKRKINDATRRSTKDAASDSVPREASLDTFKKRKTLITVDRSVENSSIRPQKKFRWIATVSDKGLESRKSTKIQEIRPSSMEALLKTARASDIAAVLSNSSRNSVSIEDRAVPIMKQKLSGTNVASITGATKSNHVGKAATIPTNSSQKLNRSAKHRAKEHRSWKKQNNDFAYVPTSTNKYCMFFNKFGKCRSGTSCIFKHDASKISVCRLFLLGRCSQPDCPLSHTSDPEKMSDCEYFARGSCLKDNCTYRHVKHNPDTKACEGFNIGFCASGSSCKLRHILFQQTDLAGNTKHARKSGVDKTAATKYVMTRMTSGTVNGSISLCSSDAPSHIASVTASITEEQPLLDDHLSKRSRADLEETDLFIPLPEDEDYPDSDNNSESDLEGEDWDRGERNDDEDANLCQEVESDRESKETGSLPDMRTSATEDLASVLLDADAISSQEKGAEKNRRVREELRRAGIIQFFPSGILSSAMSWM